MGAAPSAPVVVVEEARTPVFLWLALGVMGLIGTTVLAYILLLILAPRPRPPFASEKQYTCILPNGGISAPQPLPCWYDNHMALKKMAKQKTISMQEAFQPPDAEVFMTLVVPAYNEENRLAIMLQEAVQYLEDQYGLRGAKPRSVTDPKTSNPRQGWEVILVSDGSTDRTVDVALHFARTYQLRGTVNGVPVPTQPPSAVRPPSIPPGAIRVVKLEKNRGKGGAVTHGMRHARGSYIVFADADGASRFTDLGKLVAECEHRKDKLGRAVCVGSRAHMVGTDAVVKRSLLRNFLMRGFHLGIWLLTTPRVAKIRDTQCGFKLFSRPALPYIIPYMHSEGWIFDVEMLMLAESARIPMSEVPVGWKEVGGSKLNVIKDSLGMAWGLAVLRVAWGTGIFSRD